MDVVALKTPKLRGQAWVVFTEITAASNAVRQMQNFPFYDKPMVGLKEPIGTLLHIGWVHMLVHGLHLCANLYF